MKVAQFNYNSITINIVSIIIYIGWCAIIIV